MMMELSSPEEPEVALPQQPADIMASLQRPNNDDDDDWTSTTATAAADEEPPIPDEELPEENRRTTQNSRTSRNNTRNNNNNNRTSNNMDIHSDDIQAEIQRFNNTRRSTSRTRQQQRVRRLRSTGRPIISSINSTETYEAQTKQIIYMGISVIIIGGIVLVLLRYKGKALNLVCLIGLMCCIVYLYLKFQRLRQIQRLSIHENSHFSYAVSDASGNHAESDYSPRTAEEFEDNLRASSSSSAAAAERRRHQITRDSGSSLRLMRQNQFFMDLLLQSLRQSVIQLGASISQESGLENGYSEQQINEEIKGACKYGELQLIHGENNNKSDLVDERMHDNEGEDGGFKVSDKDENTCVICLEGYGENSDVRILKCKHFFHVFCLDEWLKKKKECPVCRQSPLLQEQSQAQQPLQQQQQQPSNSLNSTTFNGHEILIPMSPEILLGMLSRQPLRSRDLFRIRSQPSRSAIHRYRESPSGIIFAENSSIF